MLDFVHSVPGRLRVQGAALRRNAMLARRAQQQLIQLPGVETVTPNPATGSLVVRYDPRELTCERLWESLSTLGLTHTTVRTTEANTPDLGRIVAEMVSKTVLTKLAERSALALVGALI